MTSRRAPGSTRPCAPRRGEPSSVCITQSRITSRRAPGALPVPLIQDRGVRQCVANRHHQVISMPSRAGFFIIGRWDDGVIETSGRRTQLSAP